MKKAIASIALASTIVGVSSAQAQFEAPSIDDLSISGAFVFESEYVFRGQKLSQESFQPQIEFGLPVGGGNLYLGIWTNLPTDNQGFFTGNEVDPYVGFAYPVTDMITVDVGFTYYWFPDVGPGANFDRNREVYVGVQVDAPDQIFVVPAVYLYYDFDLEQILVEGSVGYTLDLEELAGAPGTALELSGYAGVLQTDDTAAGQADPALGFTSGENGYAYWGLNADLVYSLNENVAFSLGLRYAGNNDDATAGSTSPFAGNGSDSLFWWGASTSFSY